MGIVDQSGLHMNLGFLRPAARGPANIKRWAMLLEYSRTPKLFFPPSSTTSSVLHDILLDIQFSHYTRRLQLWLHHVRLPFCLLSCLACPCHAPSVPSQLTLNTEQIRTTVTDLLKINHPIMLAGMNVAAGPKLAAAVTNAGGIGVIGGNAVPMLQSYLSLLY